MQIIYEDNYLLAIAKPSGTQSDADRHGNPSAEAQVDVYLRKTYPWKKQLIAGLAHRLDRAVSGALIFGTTQAALKNLLAQFEQRTVGKHYLAILEKIPTEDSGELVHWLRKDDSAKRAVVGKATTKTAHECRLRYKVLQKKGEQCLVEIELLTGRYHQIRAQMAAIGCPVLGDEKYGAHPIGKPQNTPSSTRNVVEMIYLHSHRLVFDHPKTGERMEVTVETPDLGDWPNWK